MYPAPNLDLARKIYGILNKIEVEVSRRPLLYAQLLHHVGLKVDLDVKKKRSWSSFLTVMSSPTTQNRLPQISS